MNVKRKTSSSNFENRDFLGDNCPLSRALESVSGRWKMQTLYSIYLGETRFSSIKKRLGGVSDRMLGLRLEELQSEKLVTKVRSTQFPRYAMTARGKKLIQLMERLLEWEKEKI